MALSALFPVPTTALLIFCVKILKKNLLSNHCAVLSLIRSTSILLVYLLHISLLVNVRLVSKVSKVGEARSGGLLLTGLAL